MQHKENHLHMDRKRGGFTMMELLLVIAILGVLFALAVGGLLEIRKKLRQQELDAKAEIIYAAAQNRVAELRAAGYGGKLTDSRYTLHKMTALPSDAVTDVADVTLYYVTSEEKDNDTSLAGEILPQTCVDAELWGNHWLIEYNGNTGLVYAVFYSETDEIPTVGDSQTDVRANLRNRAKRLSGGAKFGYYGGDITLGGKSYTLTPQLIVDNVEELKVTMICRSPNVGNGIYPSLKFDLTVRDVLTNKSKTISIQPQKTGQDLYKAEFVLDSLADSGKNRFSALFPDLIPGNNISVTLTVRAGSTGSATANVIPKSVSQETNSLFAYEAYEKNLAGYKNANKANIAFRRHLQNLDTATSKVTDRITAAYLTTNLDFRKSPGTGVASFYSFKPITNDFLKTFSGKNQEGRDEIYGIKNLYITGSANGGLFATFRGTAISDLILTDTRIAGSVTNAGGLIGTLSNATTTISNCRVYQTDAQGGKYEDLLAVANDSNYRAGSFAGGLVGVVNSKSSLTVKDSFAATTLATRHAAGGAVGLVQSGGSVTFQDSYTDCYLAAPYTGGVVGQAGPGAKVTVCNFYTAGYQKASSVAAGVVPENTATVSMSNGYCAVSYEVGKGATVYTSAVSPTWDRVYAMEPTNLTNAGNTTVTVVHVNDNSLVPGEDLAKATMVGEKLDGSYFRADQYGSTSAYNLLNQGLDNYPYPRLKNMHHYGDWEMTAQAMNLVYYERYADNTYGVYGPGFELDEGKEIIGDGYGILLTAEPENGKFQITYKEKQTLEIPAKGNAVYHQVTGKNEKTYYLLSVTPRVVKQGNDIAFDGDNYLAEKLTREDGSFYSKVMLQFKDADGKEGRQYTYYLNPNFAKTVVASDTLPDTPGTVSLRTPRHLAALSKAYGSGDFWALFQNAGSSYTFRQERTLNFGGNYQWGNYAHQTAPASLAPIGKPDSPFAANYDGQCYEIQNLSIDSKNLHTGLFGHVNGFGALQNVFLVGGENKTTFRYSGRNKPLTVLQTTADQLAMGALAGYNGGRITNCAVSGYTARVAGFSQSAAYVGGLVGTNAGTIENCAVDTPTLSLRFTSSTGKIGGLVGSNLTSGSITGCYSLGHLEVTENKNGNVCLSGFVGENYGSIARCYSGCALEAAGATELYGFGRKDIGTARNCYYIDGGTYSYTKGLYSFNASTNDYGADAAGTPITGADLKAKAGELGMEAVTADHTYHHENTQTAENRYNYPGTVTRGGSKAHFGNWPNQEKDLGTLGVYYWEYEQGGSNSGYHLYYLGTTQSGEGIKTFDGNNLCTHHDDGGVITQYGYGYFCHPTTENGDIRTVTLEHDEKKFPVGERNQTAENELRAQLPQYEFVAYTTGDNSLRLTGAEPNGTWTLWYNGNTYTYSLCPFFAKAISLDSYTIGEQEKTMPDAKPGYSENSEKGAYQVRSIQQLQYINWNWKNGNTTTSIAGLSNNEKGHENVCFPYLLCEVKENAGSQNVKDLYWSQTHDLNAAGAGNFTPIGSMYDASVQYEDSEADIAAFSSSYNGHSYAIKNVNITSNAECVGLFGITTGAKMEDIVLYADQTDRGVIRVKDRDDGEWYCIGGLVGLAGHRDLEERSYFKNCTVSGCTIIDERSLEPGWGGGCVGGLVGATNMSLTNCTAVSTIQANMTYGGNNFKNCRVGGLVGSSKGYITNCYAGGKIERTARARSGSNIWVGGLLGGIVLRNTGSLAKVLGSTTGRMTTVENSYSYVELPKADGRYGTIKTVHAIASNGELQVEWPDGKEWGFKPVDAPNDQVKIINCYALQSAVSNSDDYRAFKDSPVDQFNGQPVNLNVFRPQYGNRQIILENLRSPYLTYDDMKEHMGGWLSGFGEVSTVDQETGAYVGGKYSYPGTDGDLKKLNLPYPFPTVLTQEGINVHYGAWPKHGLYWETEIGTMDLMVDRQPVTQTGTKSAGETLSEESASEQTGEPQTPQADPQAPETGTTTKTDTYVCRKTFKLKRIDLTGTGGVDASSLKFQYSTEDGTAIEADKSPVFEVSEKRGAFDTDGAAPITLEARRPGTVVVEASANDGKYSAKLTVIVTAELKIVIQEAEQAPSVYEGESKTIPVTLQNKDGKTIEGLSETQLKWTLPQNTDNAKWAIQADKEHSGQYTLTVTGSKAGPEKLTLSDQFLKVLYTHDEQTTTTFEANARLTVEVKPSIVLGLGAGKNHAILEGDTVAMENYNQVSVPYVQKADAYPGKAPTAEDVKPLALDDVPLYLYMVCGEATYTSLNQLAFAPIQLETNKNPSVQLTISGNDLLLVQQNPFTPDAPEETPGTAKANLRELRLNLKAGQELYANDSYALLVGDVTTDTNTNESYRALQVIELSSGKAPEQQWTLDLKLTRQDKELEGESFLLTYNRPNTLSFLAPNQVEGQEPQILLTKRLAQGRNFDSTEMLAFSQELNQNLAEDQKATRGYFWNWEPVKELTGNVKISPTETGIPFKITYHGNFTGDTAYGKPEDQKLTYGEMDGVQLVQDVSMWNGNGMTFDGWFDQAEGGNKAELKEVPNGELNEKKLCLGDKEFIPDTLNQELPLYAHWKANTYTVKTAATETDDRMDAADGRNFTYGQTGEKWIPQEPEAPLGYTFTGWTYGENQTPLEPDTPWPWETYVPTQDGEVVILEPHWAAIPLELTLLSGEDSKPPIPYTIEDNDGNLPACPEDWEDLGTFEGWRYQEELVTTTQQLLTLLGQERTATLTAVFTPNPEQEDEDTELSEDTKLPGDTKLPEDTKLSGDTKLPEDNELPEDTQPKPEAPGADTPPDDTPPDDMPPDDMPSDDTPPDETPSDETPQDDTPEDDQELSNEAASPQEAQPPEENT